MLLTPVGITAKPPAWKMFFDEAVETILLETVDCDEPGLTSEGGKRKSYNVPKHLRDAGITETDFRNVESAEIIASFMDSHAFPLIKESHFSRTLSIH